MSAVNITTVRGPNGMQGTIALPPEEWGRVERVPIRLQDGREILVAPDLLGRQEDGSAVLRLSADELGAYRVSGGSATVPVAREELHVSKRRIDSGKVVVHTAVKEHDEMADVPLLEETIEVRHVPIGRIVEGPVPVRQEGDTIIVPLLEEVLVVEKKLCLREEVHIVRHRQDTHRPQKVRLRREEATMERADQAAPLETTARGVPAPDQGRSP